MDLELQEEWQNDSSALSLKAAGCAMRAIRCTFVVISEPSFRESSALLSRCREETYHSSKKKKKKMAAAWVSHMPQHLSGEIYALVYNK